jgi:hypothetical protein
VVSICPSFTPQEPLGIINGPDIPDKTTVVVEFSLSVEYDLTCNKSDIETWGEVPAIVVVITFVLSPITNLPKPIVPGVPAQSLPSAPIQLLPGDEDMI